MTKDLNEQNDSPKTTDKKTTLLQSVLRLKRPTDRNTIT